MAKLVVLNAGLTGRSQELQADKVSIGRVEDNTLQLAEPSVSSHHCEVFMRGKDVVVKDLDSTNGSYINGEKITESVLQPGQTLRLGQVELRLEVEGMPAPAPVPVSAPAPAPVAATASKTIVIPGGVSLNELEQGPRAAGFDTSKAFSKKSNKTNKWFLIVGIIIVVITLGVFLIAFTSINR